MNILNFLFPVKKSMPRHPEAPMATVEQKNGWIYLILPADIVDGIPSPDSSWYVEMISRAGNRYLSADCKTFEEASNTARQFCQIHPTGMITRGFPGYGFMPRLY